MTQQHPITPPPELVEQWTEEAYTVLNGVAKGQQHVANCSAQWGADQELEACRQWLEINGAPRKLIDGLLATRRPKPPSLKEEALAALESMGHMDLFFHEGTYNTIRRALEQLDD